MNPRGVGGRAERAAARARTGGRARREGRAAEVFAALWFIARGYRILGFRLRVQGVEIDMAVRRGGVLAVVEVKRRASLAEALEAVGATQLRRLQRAGLALAERSRPPHGAPPCVRLDLFALAPGRFPRHVADAWGGGTQAREASPWP